MIPTSRSSDLELANIVSSAEVEPCAAFEGFLDSCDRDGDTRARHGHYRIECSGEGHAVHYRDREPQGYFLATDVYPQDHPSSSTRICPWKVLVDPRAAAAALLILSNGRGESLPCLHDRCFSLALAEAPTRTMVRLRRIVLFLQALVDQIPRMVPTLDLLAAVIPAGLGQRRESGVRPYPLAVLWGNPHESGMYQHGTGQPNYGLRTSGAYPPCQVCFSTLGGVSKPLRSLLVHRRVQMIQPAGARVRPRHRQNAGKHPCVSGPLHAPVHKELLEAVPTPPPPSTLTGPIAPLSPPPP